MPHQDWALIATIAAPILLGLLARLLRRPNGALVGFARDLRDLITLRMVLRDTDPDQRTDLLHAHHAWRTEPTTTPRRIPTQHTRRLPIRPQD
ncbi:hypothetical protein [Streptomyces chiangmaiensis]|uniref:Uncharacterized protein n=1 Tax=Streptomyces chiangmaiensis TaxID=766497 RepID=A0ABU7FV11_9ACTN|nr:hypothetical protein [Streptomyces chiangmaiensis]MED7827955.1 hypothetical protein [Streptomyces chiangmaiensis]